ncbi:hypothetical protein GJ496_010838 [Pomphorhynchus laevis]|nr:hypothetical protein GJ496_010838 [Pomphorhynchus laevis]
MSQCFHQAFLIILLLLGIPGNCIVIIMFKQKSMRSHPSADFLVVMCISDTIYLIVLFLLVLTKFGISILHMNVICQLTMYITFVCDFVSAYTITLFTALRFTAIVFPVRSRRLYSHRSSRILNAIVVGVALILYAYMLMALEARRYYTKSNVTSSNVTATFQCRAKAKYLRLLEIGHILDTILVFIIPYITILLLNMMIVYHLRIPSPSLFKESNSEEYQINNRRCIGNRNIARSRMTKILLVTSSFYLLLKAPFHIVNTVRLLSKTRFSISTSIRIKYIVDEIFLYLNYCSLAMNLYIYVFFVSGFTHDLKKFLSFKLHSILQRREIQQ